MKQARCNTRREGLARAGDDGQPCPQRIACGGVGIIGDGIQENVGEAVAGEVILVPR
jgi:hypothetical protein